jgi:hypothetical protein
VHRNAIPDTVGARADGTPPCRPSYSSRTPVNRTLELVHGRRPDKTAGTTTVETTLGPAQRPPRHIQGPRFVRMAIKLQVSSTSTATLHPEQRDTIVSRLPLVYKRMRRPPRPGVGRDRHTTTRSFAPIYDIGTYLNHFARTWRLSLLARLACIPPLRAPWCLAI